MLHMPFRGTFSLNVLVFQKPSIPYFFFFIISFYFFFLIWFHQKGSSARRGGEPAQEQWVLIQDLRYCAFLRKRRNEMPQRVGKARRD